MGRNTYVDGCLKEMRGLEHSKLGKRMWLLNFQEREDVDLLDDPDLLPPLPSVAKPIL